MIREDRELLAELARLNSDMTPLAMRIMDDSASAAEQQDYAQRLIIAGERLRRRVTATCGAVIDGEFCGNGPLTLPVLTVEPHREPFGTCNKATTRKRGADVANNSGSQGKHEDEEEKRRDSDGQWDKDRGIPPESDSGKHGSDDDR